MKKIIVFIAALLFAASAAGCGGNNSQDNSINSTPVNDWWNKEPTTNEVTTAVNNDIPEITAPETETITTTEPHISPVETVSAQVSTQTDPDTVISRTDGSNTVKIPLSQLMEEGDKVKSFTFIIYSADGYNIGQFKGGCGLSVDAECSCATDEGWYMSEDFTAPTQGTYGEITWNVPAEAGDHAVSGGDVLFGYWWGDSSSIRLESVICTVERTRAVPVDGSVSIDVGKSVSFTDEDNSIRFSAGDIPEGNIPQTVTFNVSSAGSFRKFTGAFGYDNGDDYFQSPDTAVLTDSSSLSLTWFVPDDVKRSFTNPGEFSLGYWWSEQASVTLDSVSIRYSDSSAAPADVSATAAETAPGNDVEGFRSSSEIVSQIKVGWNLGNTLDSYKTEKSGINTETGWGNLKTTQAMIDSVKAAGFNAIRIPVTWGEHMDGDTISGEWLDRVQEVVDYAYNDGMFVILNMHHDDYIWFEPTDDEYPGDSARLKKIWEQICDRFGDYGDTLLFEGMNEPRLVGSANEWTGGTSAERDVVCRYERDFINTVRASGGNNAARTLIITSYGANAEDTAINDVEMPSDKNVVLSLHYYAPWKFTSGETTEFGQAQKDELSARFKVIKSRFIDNGLPVIIGEFGCVAVADDTTRSAYYDYYISEAKSNGIKCFVWDNGVLTGDDGYGIFNRRTDSWNEQILTAIMNGATS